MLNLVVDKFIEWNETKSCGDLYGKPTVLSLACADNNLRELLDKTKKSL